MEATNYTNMTHEFFGMGAVVNKAKQAMQGAAIGNTAQLVDIADKALRLAIGNRSMNRIKEGRS